LCYFQTAQLYLLLHCYVYAVVEICGIPAVVCDCQMTDVEAGGATVFPEIGLRLVPEKVCISVVVSYVSFETSCNVFRYSMFHCQLAAEYQ